MRPLNAEVTRKTYYGAKASTYDHGRGTEDRWLRENAAVASFMRGVSGSVLDIPVGTGRFLHLYRGLGLSVIGMDVSEEMMRQARAKDPTAVLCYGDIMKIGMSDQAVDTAVCIRLLSLITEFEMAAAMRELARVTRDRLIISLRIGPTIQRKNRSWRHRTGEFGRIIAALGFRITAQRLVREPDERVFLLER